MQNWSLSDYQGTISSQNLITTRKKKKKKNQFWGRIVKHEFDPICNFHEKMCIKRFRSKTIKHIPIQIEESQHAQTQKHGPWYQTQQPWFDLESWLSVIIKNRARSDCEFHRKALCLYAIENSPKKNKEDRYNEIQLGFGFCVGCLFAYISIDRCL